MARLRVILFKFVTSCVLVEARLLGWFIGKKPSTSRRIAVLEPCPTSIDSNGDEALIEGTCRLLLERPGNTVALFSFYDQYGGQLPDNTLYGGSLYRRSDSNARKLIRYYSWPLLLARYDEFYIIGADLIDGYYAPAVSQFLFLLLKIASLMNVKGSLISCSFNSSPPKPVLRAARKMLRDTRVHARDAYSAERLSAVLGRPVKHSADVAFGLNPKATDHGRQIVDWMRKQESVHRQVIALNVNLLPIVRQFPGREDEYVRQWGEWLARMVDKGFSFVFLPHDYRSEWSDEVALVKLLEQAAPNTRLYCLLPAVRLHAPEIKNVVSHCLLTVTGRMHLAIASLGTGVPVIAYAYQSKFEGILRLFDSEKFVRPIEGIYNDADDEASFAMNAAAQIDKLRPIVGAHVDEVLELARANVQA
jgi:polysaccharide pyruvyl transferase WcaK-like protein